MNKRTNLQRLIDLCDQGIRALTELYGECPPQHYHEECIACWSGQLIRDMREGRAAWEAELQHCRE